MPVPPWDWRKERKPEVDVRVVLALLAAIAAPAFADATSDAGRCYRISDADVRAVCLARAHTDPGKCYSVKDEGKRAQCLAEVRK